MRLFLAMVPTTRTLNWLTPTGLRLTTQVWTNEAPEQAANLDFRKKFVVLPSPLLHSSKVIVRDGSGAVICAPGPVGESPLFASGAAADARRASGAYERAGPTVSCAVRAPGSALRASSRSRSVPPSLRSSLSDGAAVPAGSM